MKTSVINYSMSRQKGLRFDASFYLSDGLTARRKVESSPYGIFTIKDVSINIFYGNRAKRIYVTKPKHGIPFLSSSDILRANLENVKLASKQYTPCIEQMTLRKGWILISRSGTIGNCAFTNAKHAQKLASEHVIRINPNNILKSGLVYAYLASQYGHSLLTQGTFGAVIQHIEPDFVASLPIPKFPKAFQNKVDVLIQNASTLREEAAEILTKARKILKEKVHLRDLSPDDYDYFGPHPYYREVSCFVRKRKDIDTTTINAFNHSERIRNIKTLLKCNTKPLYEILLGGKTFSTGSFPRVETKKGYGVMLINQSDIFDTVIKGKYISKRNVNLSNLVEYGEVLIAGVGTLGENETFCRTIFANEDLVGQLVSGEFIRMKTTEEVPSGYLFAWLSSDYGFRLLRNTQTGTKLCRPIPSLVLQIPVPILGFKDMYEIDEMVRDAHTKQHIANNNEKEAISMIECEIENWNKENNKHDIGL